ncbi:MAG: protein kinase [Pseudanabaenales cyanobacterium]|nr:protein kinase [Pseudanabaenales cyanobacterium]
MTLLIGAALQNGHYVLDSVTHQDDSGAIYRGTHVTSGQVVSVKLLRDNLPQYLESFLLRAELIDQIQRLAQLRHPNIVDNLNCFEENELLFITMEADVGLSLAQIVGSTRPRPLPEATALRYMYQIADAVSAVRQVGLQHLDLDPRLIFRKAGTNRIVLTGFGFSLVSLADNNPLPSNLTVSHQDAFQANLQSALKTSKSDIYRLAALLHYLLTGELITPGSQRGLELLSPNRRTHISKATEQAIQLGLGLPNQAPISALKEWVTLLPDLASVSSEAQVEKPVFKPDSKLDKPTAIASASPIRSQTPSRSTIQAATSDQRQISLSTPAKLPVRPAKPRLKIRNFALITTAFVSALMGLGFGTVLRYGAPSQSGGIRFDPDQSFPPLDNWLEEQPAVNFDSPYLPSEKSLAGQSRARRTNVPPPRSDPSSAQPTDNPTRQEGEFNWLEQESIIPDYPALKKPRSSFGSLSTYPETMSPLTHTQASPKPTFPDAEPLPSVAPNPSTSSETLPATEIPDGLNDDVESLVESSSGSDQLALPMPAPAPIVAPSPAAVLELPTEIVEPTESSLPD